MVERVRAEYAAGHTQYEIADLLGTTQKTIWKIMTRNVIKVRGGGVRNQRGSANTSWKGDNATYAAFHLRVQTARGKPSKCEVCGTTTAKRFEWANLTGKYEDVNDYKRMCCSCHHRHDKTIRNLGKWAQPRC